MLGVVYKAYSVPPFPEGTNTTYLKKEPKGPRTVPCGRVQRKSCLFSSRVWTPLSTPTDLLSSAGGAKVMRLQTGTLAFLLGLGISKVVGFMPSPCAARLGEHPLMIHLFIQLSSHEV